MSIGVTPIQMSELTALPLSILRMILSYNAIPWSISACRRMYDVEEDLHALRLSYTGELSQMVRQERWEEVVYLVNMTDTYTLDTDIIYYIMDSERYITGRKIVERLIVHIPKEERRDLLRNLMVYEETSILLPLLPSYSNVYDDDGKYIVKYGWVSLIQLLANGYHWSMDGIARYAAKYGRLDIYNLARSSYIPYKGKNDALHMAMIAANNDRVNVLEYIINKELGTMEEEDLITHIYDKTWSPITRSYIEERGRDDSVLSTVSSNSETEDLELYI